MPYHHFQGTPLDPGEDTSGTTESTGEEVALNEDEKSCVVMAKGAVSRFKHYFLEIEMGFVWSVAGVAIIVFVFAAIWFIDPALLTLVLQFRQARCSTENSTFLVGISNCSWTSCRIGCTREFFKCWQIFVHFEYVQGSKPYQPPWASLSHFGEPEMEDKGIARLYPNVRGCGYPPQLDCEEFFQKYGAKDSQFLCWVSTMDHSIAMTTLNLEKAKQEVIMSLIPLFIFIIFVLYAFCRLGVFSVCNPIRVCPKSHGNKVNLPNLTPKKLLDYKKSMMLKEHHEQQQQQQQGIEDTCLSGSVVQSDGRGTRPLSDLRMPPTIEEEDSCSTPQQDITVQRRKNSSKLSNPFLDEASSEERFPDSNFTHEEDIQIVRVKSAQVIENNKSDWTDEEIDSILMISQNLAEYNKKDS